MDSLFGGFLLTYGALLFGFVTMALWLIIGWRAMRAHERLADAAERAAKNYR